MAKIVSLEELGQHGASAERKWIAVDGEVFDVTAFVKLHPGVSPSGRTSGTRSLSGGPVSPKITRRFFVGGKQILLQLCGQDATEQFSLYHHDGVLRKYREKLKIGELASGRRPRVKIPFAQPQHFSRLNSPYYKETHYKFAARVQRFVDEEVLPTMDQWCEDPKGPPRELYLKMGREGFLACLTGSKAFPRKWVDPGTPEPEDYDVFHEFILVDLLSQCGIPPGTVSHATRYHMRHGITCDTVSHAARCSNGTVSHPARYLIRQQVSHPAGHPTRHGIPPGTVSHQARYPTRQGMLTSCRR
jgi:hypothetical protein